MKQPRSLRSRPWAYAIGLMAAVGVVSFGASPASAEPTLISSSPADGEQLTTSPAEIRLVFSESVSAETTVAVACNSAPAPVLPPRLEADTVTVVVPVSGTIGQAKCNVSWVVPTAAGVTQTGQFSFDVTTDAAATTEAPAGTTAPEADGEAADEDTSSSVTAPEPARVGGPLGLVRWVGTIALAALFGGLLVIALAWPEGVEYGVTLRYMKLVWIAASAATVLQVALATAQLGERSVGASLMPTAWGDLMDTTPGKALLARLLLTLAAGWVAIRPEHVLNPANRMAALAIPGLAVATWGLTRASGDLALVGAVVGIGHALATAAWFGGLMLLARVVLLGPGEEDLVHAVIGYLRYSTTALVVAVATGAVQTYRLDGQALLSSGHGRLLVLKVAGVAAMAYISMAAKPVILNRLATADHMDGRTAMTTRRAVSTEMMIGVVVLALTSWMVSTTPDGLKDSGSTSFAYDTGRTGGDLDVRIRLTSPQVGRSGVRVEVFAPADGLANLRITFRPPEADTTGASAVRLDVPLTGLGAAELPAAEGIPFAVPGEWRIEIDADGPDGRFDTLVVALPITASDDSDTTTPGGTAPIGTTPVDTTPVTTGG